MSESLARKTVSSAVWTYFSYVLSKSSNFLTTLILTQMLTPAEFGIVGFAVTSMAFLDAVRDLGVGLALIQRRDPIDEAADTAFWLNVGSNIIMWVLALIAAPFVADFFREPQILAILPVMSLSFILNSFGSTHDALLQREMAFSRRVIPSVFNSVLKGVSSIILALLGFSVWSLVFGLLIGQSVYSLLVWRMVDWQPRRRFNRTIARELVSFGYKISLDSLVSALQANIDYIFIGRLLGETALGLYTVAFRVPELIVINFCTVIAQVLYPAYSSIQNDPEQMRKTVLSALRYVSLITIPAGIGLALISPLFVTIFGEDWGEAGPIMAALSLYGMLLSISWNVGDVYKAINRADILWKTAFVEFALLAPVLYLMAYDSAFAVALGHVAVAFLVSMLRLAIAMRMLKLSFYETFSQFVPAIIGSAIMGVVVWLMLGWLRFLPGFFTLLLSILAGAAVYTAAMWFFERELLLKIVDEVRWRFSKKDASAAQGTPES